MALAGGDPSGVDSQNSRASSPELRGQRLREIAYRRLLARVFATQPERWVVKGGVALLLRLDPNRTSNDIDLAYVAQASEHAVALHALVEAAAHDLGDFFEFEIGRDQTEEVDPDHPLERALTVPVVARIGTTTFTEFSIDLAMPREDDLEIRDLADLAMIAQQKDSEGSDLIAHVRREEARRRDAGSLIEPLPTTLQLAEAQIADWSPRWKRATRDAPVTFEEAQAVAAAFLNPVLDGTADGMYWNAAAQTWQRR